MNRQVAVVGLAAVGFAAVAAVIVLRMDAPEPEEPAVAVAAPVAAPAPTPAVPAPEPEPAAPEPLPDPEPPAPVVTAPIVAPPPVDAPPTVGLLYIDSDVPGAQVFIDRRFIGSAPAVAEDVSPGPHQLNVSAEGFDSVVSSIDVTPGERTILVRLREVRLDASIDVVHKHRFGSCLGRLVATPQGLRYETSNENDGFTTPLLELDTFEVDYLDKNLSVRFSQGRQFNFTDPEDDADRLFVFHRDVERARERLRRGDTPATD